MQVSATLIAAQQAAREAQARFQAVHAPKPDAKPQTSFASALGETKAFTPLPLKQTAPQPQSLAAAPQEQPAFTRPGALLDIKI